MKTTKQRNNETNYHKRIMKLCILAYLSTTVCIVDSCKKNESIVAKKDVEKVQKQQVQNLQLFLCEKCDENGKNCQNGLECKHVTWHVTTNKCSQAHPCRLIENASDQPTATYNVISKDSAMFLLDQVADEYGDFQNRKSFVLRFWDLYAYMYVTGEISQTPDELYDLAQDDE
ncbi:MAG: hypothetical protein J6Y47_00680 [Bacteroidales bacterium]|nr:hypothetical protein [Bacteroidales bacterium]